MKYIEDRVVDELGRIVLPTQAREILRINSGNKLSIYSDGDKIILKSSRSICKICGCEEIENKELMICSDCINKIKAI